MMFKIEEPEIEINAKQSFITRQKPLLNEVCNLYGRNPATFCIKVFYGNPLKGGDTLEDALWGDNHDPTDHNQVRMNCKLMIGSKIQNILWKNGISARVYAVFEGEFRGQRVACQLTDFLTGEYPNNIHEVEKVHNQQIAPLAKAYGFSEVKDILSMKDMMGGKIIDVQQYTFDSNAGEIIRNIYCEKGRYGKKYYQDVLELGLDGGPRKSEERVQFMGLDKIDFKDKIVWDLGCAGGFFCRYAVSRGAKRVFGLDTEEQLEAAFYLGNYLGYFNIDYIEADLSKDIPKDIPKPDMAFYLSLNFHIGIPEYLKDFPFIIFEDNGKESREFDTLGKPWTDWFKNIKFIGRATDQGNCRKPIYYLWNKL